MKINENFLLLLIEKDGLIDTATIDITNHFEKERLSIQELCEGSENNIIQITQYVNKALKPTLTSKTFSY